MRILLLSLLMFAGIVAPVQAKVQWRDFKAPVVGIASGGIAAALTWALMSWWHKVQLHRMQEDLMMQQRLDRVAERHQLDHAREKIEALKRVLRRLGHSDVVAQEQAAPLEAQLLDKALDSSGTE